MTKNKLDLVMEEKDLEKQPTFAFFRNFVHKDWAIRVNQMLLKIESVPKFRGLLERVVEATWEQLEV